MPASSNRELDWLFLDLNSYFASVEQQEIPALRGKPVAVVPCETDSTCAIAASHEAKKFGVKTGTMIYEAKRMCPDLICVLARHKIYVNYHERIKAELERHIMIHNVASIDEMACQLTGKWREPANAIALAHHIKEGLKANVGEVIKCSIGLSTNRYLAKLATDLQKPNGLVVLYPDELPGRLAGGSLRDLCGIGRQMEARLNHANIYTVEQLWACAPKQLRGIWGGVGGERFYYALRGVEIPDEPTSHSCVGHSHVLSPEQRPPHLAEAVARRLLLKAASRLRSMKHLAGALTVSVRMENRERFDVERRFGHLSDSVTLQGFFTQAWGELIPHMEGKRVKKVAVTLHHLREVSACTQLDLFATQKNSAVSDTQQKRDRLASAIDSIVGKFGRDAITVGIVPGQGGSFTGTKIAFNRVPKKEDFEETGER